MCFDICTINIRVSIRVRGLHLVKIIFFIRLTIIKLLYYYYHHPEVLRLSKFQTCH
jgi:hypothetical protein